MGRWRWIAAAGTLAGLLVLAAGSSIYRMAAQPHSYIEAIGLVLDQRTIPYSRIEFSRSCSPNPRDCLFPVANVVVHGQHTTSYGRVECRHATGEVDWSDCTVSVAALQLTNVPLPALAHDPAWLIALQQRLRAALVWLRAWVPRTSPVGP